MIDADVVRRAAQAMYWLETMTDLEITGDFDPSEKQLADARRVLEYAHKGDVDEANNAC